MKVSLEWVRDFVDLPAHLSPADIARELTLKTVEVEAVLDVARPLAGVVVGRIEMVAPLGDSGRTQVTCAVGGDRRLTVVTRATGLAAGQLTAVALPGARLAGLNGAEVATVEIGGVISEGVLCSAADLALEHLFPSNGTAGPIDLAELAPPVGAPLAGVLAFDDVVLEIDNKSLTNRPDLWGHYGVARELAAICERPLRPLHAALRPAPADHLVGEIDPDLCHRLAVVEFSLGERHRTPFWMRSRLARIGERTVDLCVDLSNYVMFTVGQPNHVYDAARVTAPLSVARAGLATKLELLSGESRELEPDTPVVTAGGAPVGIAGVMGGSTSAVSPHSRRFLLEVATFRPGPIRRATQRLGLRTEASARFEKGLDTQRVDSGVDLFLRLLAETAPSATVTAMQDVTVAATQSAQVDVDLEFLQTRVGRAFEAAEVRHTLGRLGFAVHGDGRRLEITVPTWRSTGDVGLPHDIVEEVARLHGYDNLPVAPLSVPLTPVRRLNRRPMDRVIREQLAFRAGMREVVTYPWVADHLLAATGWRKADTLRFDGAPAPDRDSLRPSLIPNLLEAVLTNLPNADAFALFEVGTVFAAGPLAPYHEIFEKLPPQRTLAAAALVGADGAALFRRAKGILEALARQCHLADLTFAEEPTPQWADRSARLAVRRLDRAAGAVGVVTKSCLRTAGIEQVQVVCFELDLGVLEALPSRENRYEPVSDLPEADFDVSVVVPDAVRWSDVTRTIASVDPLIHRVVFVDEFRGTAIPPGHKSLTVRAVLRPVAATLSPADIAAVRTTVIAELEQALGARLRT